MIYFTATCPGLMTTNSDVTSSVVTSEETNQHQHHHHHQQQQQVDNKQQDAAGKVIQSLRLSDAKRLLDYNSVTYNGAYNGRVTVPYKDSNGRILPDYKREALQKIGHSIGSLQNGVLRAHLISPSHDGSLLQELFTRDGSGTLISRDLYDGIRRATDEDITGILDVIRPLVESGNLVARGREELERDIALGHYHCFVRDGLIVGTCQLRFFESEVEGGEETAEMGCLVVHRDYRKSGRGDAILGYLERLCLGRGVHKMFVLSTQTQDWFLERGFKVGKHKDLPKEKAEGLNRDRGSRVYVKVLEGEREVDQEELMWDR